MDIRELRYFAAVFRERNLTAAAKRCFMSQPSISAAITHLEAELGTTLFIRHKKGVAPTAAAEQFHAVARRIIDEADAAHSLFRKPSTQNALTLGLMRTLDRPRTIALLKPLTGAADIALRLVGGDDAGGRADRLQKPAARRRAFRCALERALRRSAAAVASADAEGAAAHRRSRRRRMIDRCHCEQSEFFGRAAAGSRQTAAIAQSEDWAMALVAAGVGIAIVPEGVARGDPDVAVREIEVKVKREVGLAYARRDRRRKR